MLVDRITAMYPNAVRSAADGLVLSADYPENSQSVQDDDDEPFDKEVWDGIFAELKQLEEEQEQSHSRPQRSQNRLLHTTYRPTTSISPLILMRRTPSSEPGSHCGLERREEVARDRRAQTKETRTDIPFALRRQRRRTTGNIVMSLDTETLRHTQPLVGRLSAITNHLKSHTARPARGCNRDHSARPRASPRRLSTRLNYFWPLYARDSQLPPDGDWDTWLILAGRGFGKTRTGAEWVRAQVETRQADRIALVARSLPEALSIMVHGESGIINISPPWDKPIIRTLQAKANLAQRSARPRILKPRTRSAKRPAVRRRLVRRVGVMGIPGTDLGQPLFRTQARTTTTLSRHHNAQAHRVDQVPAQQPRHIRHTRLHLR